MRFARVQLRLHTGEKRKEGKENGSAVAKSMSSSLHVNGGYGRCSGQTQEPKVFFSPREIRGGRMTVPVSAGRRQRLWTPSSSRGRGVAKRPLGKLSGRQDSRERSRSAWFPTIWQRLEAKDSFKGGSHARAVSIANGTSRLWILTPGTPGRCSLAGRNRPRAQRLLKPREEQTGAPGLELCFVEASRKALVGRYQLTANPDPREGPRLMCNEPGNPRAKT